MGTRFIRLPARDFAAKLPALQGAEVHVVLHSGTTHKGILHEIGASSLVLWDTNRAWYSRKRHTHTIAFAEVQEVISDRAS